jgi:hypothetical protein
MRQEAAVEAEDGRHLKIAKLPKRRLIKRNVYKMVT